MENKKENIEIWRKGIPLIEALDKFCDLQTIRKIQSLDKPAIPTQKREPKFEDVFTPIQQMMSYSSSIQTYKKENLFKRIQTGKLIATGYSCPRNASDLPEEIPLDMWCEEYINWKKSSIKGNALEFVSVRISKKNNKVEKLKLKDLPNSKIENKLVGRPSKKDAIREAYEELEKAGRIDYSKTMKAHVRLIQDTVRHLNPDIQNNKGMQEEVIRRVIREKFEKYCATSKPASKL